MDDDPVPRSCKGQTYVRKFITSTLLMAAMAAEAQEQKVLQSISDDDPKTQFFNRTNSIKEEIDLGDFKPYITTKIEDENGYYTAVSSLEMLTSNNRHLSTITDRFMTELGNQLGNDATLVFKSGLSLSENEAYFHTALSRFNNTDTDITSSECIVFGYIKYGTFTELGIICSTAEGFYVIPNPKQLVFWAQDNETLLQKSGILVSSTDAIYLDNPNFDHSHTNLSLRAWQDFICG